MESFQEFMSANPHYGYLIGVVGLGIYLLGLIMDWNWAVEPGGGYFNVQYWIETFGRKTVRIVLGVFTLIGLAAFLALFLYAGPS